MLPLTLMLHARLMAADVAPPFPSCFCAAYSWILGLGHQFSSAIICLARINGFFAP